MTASPPDPIAILLAEHEAASRRFAALEEALAALSADDPAATAEALETVWQTLAFLDRDLEVHIRKEEEPLFPLLKAALPADDRLIDEMVAEHDQARLKRERLRAALEELSAGHDDVREGRERLRGALAAATGTLTTSGIAALRQAARAVLQTLRVHFQNEEELVFPLAPQLLTAEQLAEAGQQMIAIDQEEREAMTSPADTEHGRTRPPGITSGSPQRPPQRLTGPVLTFDLMREVDQLRAEPAWQDGDRNAKTLVKGPDFRVVLTALKAGAGTALHRVETPVSVQVLSGRVRVHLPDGPVELGAGGLLVLDRGVPHRVEALAESAFLLTLPWREGQGA
jgi:quercetin dioxygenase-like cupin family protein/hemerythrin-like domain-containing protein